MAARSTTDALLIAARALLLLTLFLTASAALVFVLCIPLVGLRPELALAMLVGHPVVELPPGVLGLMPAIIAAGLLMFLAILYALKQLLGIVDTVAAGDPFVPANASRLTRMGWAVLAAQVILPALLGDLEVRLQRSPSLADSILVIPTTEASVADSGGNGIVLVMVLFILARVFRAGTKLREDLEGTV